MKTIGILVVDAQQDYFPGGAFPLPHMPEASRIIARLLTIGRAQGWPVVHVRHVELDPQASFLRTDTAGTEIHPLAAPFPGESVITKHYPNSFRETPLGHDLQAAAVQEIVVCGAMTNMCIDATVRAAFDFGLVCTVIHDGCAACPIEFLNKTIPAEAVQSAFMGALASAYATVVSLDEFEKAVKGHS